MDHQDTLLQPQPTLRKKPVDQWSVRERLALASAVSQSGDQNWVSVSRAIRPFAEPGRRFDWFSQKNCALQYADLLEKVETPKRKRSERGEIIETPGMQILRKLTVDRLEEIKLGVTDFTRQTKKLKIEMEMVSSGHCDEKLAEIWEQIQLRLKEKEEKAAAAQRALEEDRKARAAHKGRQQHAAAAGGSASVEFEDSSTQDSALSDSVDVEEPSSAIIVSTSQSMSTGGQHQPSGTVLSGSSAFVDSKSRDTPPPPPSHLLTTLLQKKTPLDMSCLRKDDVNKPEGTESLLCPTLKKMDHQLVLPGVTPSAGAPTLTMLLNTSSSGASMGIRQVPGAAAVSAVVAAPATSASSVTSAAPPSILPVAISAAVIGTTVGSSALYSLAMPTMLTSPASTVPAVSQASVLVDPVSAEPASPPAASPQDTDIFTDTPASATVSDVIETPTELLLRLPISVDAPMSAEANQPVEVCMDVVEAAEVIVENEIVTTDQSLETDSSLDHCQAAGDVELAVDDSAHSQIVQAELEIVATLLPAAENREPHETAETQLAPSVAEPPHDAEEEQPTGAATVESESGMPIEQALPEDAAATDPSVTTLSPPSLTAAPEAPAAYPSLPPLPPLPILGQPPSEEAPAIDTSIIADAPQAPVTLSPVSEEALELKTIVEKSTSSPDAAGRRDVAQPPASVKHGGKTTGRRSGDVGRNRRRSRGPKKASAEAAGTGEDSATEQLTVDSATAVVATSEEAPMSILPTTAFEDVHRETQQPEACPRPEDVTVEALVPVSVEMISEEIKEMTSESITQADTESKVSVHVDLIPPSMSAASIESSNPPLTAASPGASSAASVPSVPAPVGELTSTKHLPVAAGSGAESLPCSPASVPLSDDSEEEKSYKIWRKAITLVWRSVANHKYANVFLHPVTDDIAPGYTSCVYRPMDLQTIKKNIENGMIKTTAEFQRDMMLMFTNAIMYNDTNHDVYKMAMEMYDDAMQHIEQFVHTQLMLKEQETKVVSLRGRRDAAEKDDEKRRLAYDHGEGGKRKRTRADDDK